MARRSVPDDLFYDPEVVGVMAAEEATPGGDGWRPVARVDNDEFHHRAGDAGAGSLAALAWRLAANGWTFAAVLTGLGFFTVFINQAPFQYQLIFGAPIFEEFLKFGLALLISYPLRWAAFRVPIAAGVGAGFGILEHEVTYWTEDDLQYAWRIVFHAAATVLSMVSYQALQNALDVRARWASTLLATAVHYGNNFLAVGALALLGWPAIAEAYGFVVSTTMIVLALVATIWVAVAPGRFRGFIERRLHARLQPAPDQ